MDGVTKMEEDEEEVVIAIDDGGERAVDDKRDTLSVVKDKGVVSVTLLRDGVSINNNDVAEDKGSSGDLVKSGCVDKIF